MERKSFIQIIAVSVTAFAIPFSVYRCGRKASVNPLINPETLSQFCNTKTIEQIGLSYRKKLPAENQEKYLRTLLLTNNAGSELKTEDPDLIATLLEKKTAEDFKTGKIQVLQGWVIAETEARQSALFSILNH